MNQRLALLTVYFAAILLLTSFASFAQNPNVTTQQLPSSTRAAPPQLPDLVISALTARSLTPDKVQYEWTITNIGTVDANLDGPSNEQHDNVSVQAFVSKDTLFRNDDDRPAGGTILGLSPLGKLAPGKSISGRFTSNTKGDIRDFPTLVIMVDWGKVIDESNEKNNFAAVGMAQLMEIREGENTALPVEHDEPE